jgi:cytochrome c5
MRTLMALAVCYVAASALAPPALAQRAPLSSGPGKDAVEAACSTCHSLSYIPMNSHFMAPGVWKAEVTKMRTAFGAPIDDDAANEIIVYLTSHYGNAQK